MKCVSVLVQHHAGATGDVLICKNKDGVWTFPTDKIRTNETDEEAAARVAFEQAGIVAKVNKRECVLRCTLDDGVTEHIVEGNITHNTNSKFVFHNYYSAINTWQYEPKCDCGCEFKWVHPTELAQYEFAGDDKVFLAKYDPWVNARPIPDVR